MRCSRRHLVAARVGAEVLCEVVRPREPFAALAALVRFDTGVAPLVPGQLVTARKSPLAALEHADERLLARVSPDVRL